MTEEMSKTEMDPNDSELAWEEENSTKDNQDHASASTRKSTKSKSNGQATLNKNSQVYKDFRANNNISVRKSYQKTKERQKALREEVQALRKEISEIKQSTEIMQEQIYSLQVQLDKCDWDIHYLKILKGRAEPDNCDECQKRSRQGFGLS